MTPRINFNQALAFAIDRGAISLWVEGEDLRYTCYRNAMRPPYLPELTFGYMKLAAPMLEKYQQLEFKF